MSADEADAIPSAGRLSLLGGRVSLDFANTISGQATLFEKDHLVSVAALAAWLRHAGLIRSPVASAMDLPADPAILRRALELRDVINRIGTALVEQQSPDPNDLAALNKAAGDGLGQLELVPGPDGQFGLVVPEALTPDGVLARLALDMIDHLRFADLSRLRRCEGEDCGWLFHDSSKAGRRRWCDMTVCGNRAKARRHRAKITCSPVM